MWPARHGPLHWPTAASGPPGPGRRPAQRHHRPCGCPLAAARAGPWPRPRAVPARPTPGAATRHGLVVCRAWHDACRADTAHPAGTATAASGPSRRQARGWRNGCGSASGPTDRNNQARRSAWAKARVVWPEGRKQSSGMAWRRETMRAHGPPSTPVSATGPSTPPAWAGAPLQCPPRPVRPAAPGWPGHGCLGWAIHRNGFGALPPESVHPRPRCS